MSDISVGVVYLAFLSLPGIVASRLYGQLTRRQSKKNWQEFVDILLFSLTSYLVYYLLASACNFLDVAYIRVSVFDTLQNLGGRRVDFNWAEILFCVVIAVFLGYAAAYLNNHKLVTKLGRICRVTKRYGDEDLWDFFHNMEDIPPWAFVKDHRFNLLYFAKVNAFSESGMARELILEDVRAYNIDTAEELFQRDVLYLSRDPFDLTIEIPDLDFEESSQGEGEDGSPIENG